MASASSPVATARLGIDLIDTGVGRYRTISARTFVPLYLSWQGVGYAGLGQHEQAQRRIDEALSVLADTQERWQEPLVGREPSGRSTGGRGQRRRDRRTAAQRSPTGTVAGLRTAGGQRRGAGRRARRLARLSRLTSCLHPPNFRAGRHTGVSVHESSVVGDTSGAGRRAPHGTAQGRRSASWRRRSQVASSSSPDACTSANPRTTSVAPASAVASRSAAICSIEPR